MTETERIAQLEEALRRMVIRIDRNAVWKRNEEDPDIVFARSVLGKVM